MKCIFMAFVKTATRNGEIMKNRCIKLILSGVVILTSSVLLQHAQAQSEKRIKIVTTIGQITDATRIIGGDHVLVSGLMGPGVDPHLYKASESDVSKLAEAQMIIYGGLYLEAKMEPMFERLKKSVKTVPVGEAVPVEMRLDSINYKGHYDPHIWFDVTLWQKAVEEIALSLIDFDPAHKDEYLERAAKYNAQLDELNEYVTRRANELPETQRVLVTAHDAFRYFGRKYGFEVVGLQGISTEAQAGTKDVMELADFITKRKIPAIFVESSVPERNIKAVQDAVRARGWDVKIGGELFSDAMGDEGTFKGTYIGMVTHNIDTIVNALKGWSHER
jgi:manganese/zinc/iron transport system substrate-binding protein